MSSEYLKSRTPLPYRKSKLFCGAFLLFLWIPVSPDNLDLLTSEFGTKLNARTLQILEARSLAIVKIDPPSILPAYPESGISRVELISIVQVTSQAGEAISGRSSSQGKTTKEDTC